MARSFALYPGVIKELVPANGAHAVAFAKDRYIEEEEDRYAPADIIYGMSDGTGIALRRKHTSKTRRKKGRKENSKPKDAKMVAFFKRGIDSENKPFQFMDSTTFVATLDRLKKFEKAMRAKFDRKFGHQPKLMIYISDGGKWTQTVHK